MEFKPVFYACLVLCVFVFFEVLFSIRKNSLLKICFLLILSSLFVMNYFSIVPVENRLQFVLVKAMRLIYACSTMLAIIHMVTPKIPRWIIGIISISTVFLIGIRVFFFNEIDIEGQSPSANQVFSVGHEFYTPHPVMRYIAFTLVTVAVGITFYYYRRFFMKMNKEAVYYKQLSRWIISIVLPFFLLTIFGVLGIFHVFQQSASHYLFSFFSCTIVFSILFRPRFLNSTSYFDALVPATARNTDSKLPHLPAAHNIDRGW